MNRTNRGRTGRLRGYYSGIYTYFKENYIVLILAVIFLGGVLAGSAIVAWLDSATVKNMLTVVNGFLGSRKDQEFTTNFISSITNNLILLILLFFCGFCAISSPIIMLVPFFKGLGFGLSAGTMFAYYGIKAAAYIGILILPNTVFSFLIILMGCREALKLSRTFLSVIRPLQRGTQPYSPGRYCAKYMLFLLLLCVGSALEAYLYTLFASLLVL